MLAHNFLTHRQLKLRMVEWSSLVQVLFLLERDLLHPFSMTRWDQCMGGHAERIGGFVFGGSHILPAQLAKLFYPNNIEHVTREHATLALRDYLTTGVTNHGLGPTSLDNLDSVRSCTRLHGT